MGNTNNRQTTNTNLPVVNVDAVFQHDKTALNILAESLQQRSYAILRYNDLDKIQEFHNLINSVNQFFCASPNEKQKLEKESNIGYVDIPEIREFLKFRTSEVVELEECIPNFVKGTDSLQTLANICWSCFSHLISVSATPISTEEQKDLKLCLEERASLSIIHYYPAGVNESTQDSENTAQIPAEADKTNGVLHVCSKHQDTGLMTLVMTSGIPGLDVYDTLEKKWLKLEEMIQPFRDSPRTEIMVLMLGQKAPIFLGNEPSYQPTIHRVTLPKGVERNSFLYFMDTAKVS